MNEKIKPKKCNCEGCNNNAYGKNYLTKNTFEWVCRKHYYDFNYGITEKYWSKDKQ